MAIRFDPNYAISVPWGVLRLGEFILGIIVHICCGVVDVAVNGAGFIQFTATGSLVTALVILILYCLHIPDTASRLPWALLELITSGVWALFYFISGCVAAGFSGQWRNYYSNRHACYGAAAFFCFLGALLFGFNAFLQFRNWRAGAPVPTTGSHTVTTSTTYEEHTTTYPAGKY